MLTIIESLLDWVYKKKCYFCRSSKEAVKMCSKCYDTLEYLPVKVNRTIDRCNVFCAGVYNKNLQKLIRGLKYHKQKDLAFYMAKFMYDYWQKIDKTNDYEIVPVPIFKAREKKRKYNHMNLTAEEFCKLSGYTVNYRLITRIKDTKPQYKLSKKERSKNLSGAFAVDKTQYNGKKLLLIDDICTTGSTFEEMIKELKNAGINDISCLACSTPFEE